MVIRTNKNANRSLNVGKNNALAMQKSTQKLASGLRINSAADDASGLAITQKMRVLISELSECDANVGNGISVTQTADGALNEVSSMLIRVQELSVAAANGVYTDEDKKIVSAEIDQIYVEIDRICESTTFNGRALFRGTPDGVDENFYWDYVEEVVPVDGTVVWGDSGLIEEKPLDYATAAKGATAVIPFDEDVVLNKSETLIGKSFTFAKDGYTQTYTFTAENGLDNSYNQIYDSSAGSYYYGSHYVSIKDLNTVQEVFDRLADKTSTHKFPLDKENTIVSTDLPPAITLCFEPTDLPQEPVGDGSPPDAVGGNGKATNGITITCSDSNKLNKVDEAENTFTYQTELTRKITFMSGRTGAITDAEYEDLLKNTLHIGPNHITFNSTGGGNSIKISKGMTTDNLRKAINEKINALDKFNSKLEDGVITVTTLVSDTLYTNYSSTQIYESSPSTTKSKTINGLDITFNLSKAPSDAQLAIGKITIPDIPDTKEFSIKINNKTYLFYDRSILPEGDSHSYSSYEMLINTETMSTDAIMNKIRDCVADASGIKSENVTIDGNVITIKAETYDIPLVLNEGNVGGVSTSITGYTYSDKVLTDTYTYFTPIYSVDFDLSACDDSPFNPAKLNDSGFKLDNIWYEFVNGNDDLSSMKVANRIDISGCTSFKDIQDKMNAAIPKYRKNDGEDPIDAVTITEAGVATISAEHTLTYTPPSSNTYFSDGNIGSDGAFTNAGDEDFSIESSGGENTTKPQTSIDFSGYTDENLDDLLGTGFRITCATCPNEFINIMFCEDKEEATFPPYFETDTDPVRRIPNYAVEIKDIRGEKEIGKKIVEGIIEQISGVMDHYTNVEVGDPNYMLSVSDKRFGDQPLDESGDEQRSYILPGVVTNAKYTVTITKVPIIVETDGVPISEMLIYVGSHPKPQYIPIHLPFLSLETLKLDPPKPSLETNEKAMVTSQSAKVAASTISACRSVLGADQNRLEYAQATIKSYEAQTSESNSRIKDADMAKVMMENTKYSILQQTQQAMFSHSLENTRTAISSILEI